jgi:hypothetical protein
VGVGVFKRTDISYLDVFIEVDHLVQLAQVIRAWRFTIVRRCVRGCVCECVCEQPRNAFVEPQYFDEGL